MPKELTQLEQDLSENLTEEELALLSDDDDDILESKTLDELGGEVQIIDGDDIEEVIPSSNKEEGDDDDDNAEGDDDGDGEEGEANADAANENNADAKDDADPAPEDKKPDETPEADENTDDDDELSSLRDLPKSQNVEVANSELERIHNDLAELKKQRLSVAEDVDDGELTNMEGRVKIDEIEAKMDALKDKSMEIRTSFKLSVDNAKEHWFETTVPHFTDANPIYTTNNAMAEVFNNTVVAMQEKAIASGKDPLSPAILEKADAAIRKQMPQMFAAPKADPAPDEKNEKKVAEKPKRDRQRVPSLADVPAAQEDIGTSNKFKALDDLPPGQAYEDAFAKLSPAEQEEYMNQM